MGFGESSHEASHTKAAEEFVSCGGFLRVATRFRKGACNAVLGCVLRYAKSPTGTGAPKAVPTSWKWYCQKWVIRLEALHPQNFRSFITGESYGNRLHLP